MMDYIFLSLFWFSAFATAVFAIYCGVQAWRSFGDEWEHFCAMAFFGVISAHICALIIALLLTPNLLAI